MKMKKMLCLQHKPTMSQGKKRATNSTKREEKHETQIPNDLIIEIFSRLPAKSIARFYCLSKFMCSMLHRPYFTELFLTISSARPRLLLFVRLNYDEWSIYSSPQTHNPYGNSSSLVVAADFHMKSNGYLDQNICSYTSGLVFLGISNNDDERMNVIRNPITGHYATLPQQILDDLGILGFDPIDKKFKVLLAEDYARYKILTLEGGKMSWRSTIDCPLYHESLGPEICINGVCYYLIHSNGRVPSKVIICFDVKTEKFKIIDAECFCDQRRIKLINYKGRLGGACCKYNVNTLELCMCVLEDVEKQEWSRRVYSLGENVAINQPCHGCVVGATATGEIVLSMTRCDYDDEPFFVHYFNPERNTLQSVEIRGFEKPCRVFAFVDHVEDLNANDAKELKSRSGKQGLNIIRERPKPQERHTENELLANLELGQEVLIVEANSNSCTGEDTR